MKSYLNHIRTFFHNHYKKIIGVMVLLLIILVVILPRKQEAPEMYTVTMRDVIEGVRVGGLVEAASVADLGFAASGQVRTVSVGIGDRVRAGQVLATLDSSILAAELRDAEAQLAIARAQKDNQATNLRDVERQQNIIVQNAYRALLSSDIQARPYSRTSTLARPIVSGAYTGNQEGVYEIIVDRRSTAQYFVRLSGLERGEYELLRNQATPIGTRGLFIQFNGELLDYLDTRWIIELPNTQSLQYASLLNAYEQAEQNKIIALRTAEQSLAQSGSTSIAEAQIRQAEARITRIRATMSQYVIRAPFDGVITSVDARQGETALAGVPLIKIVADDEFFVVLNVPEIDIAKLTVGNTVNISLDVFRDGASWLGTITSISPAETRVDGVPVYKTYVVFNEKDDRIRSGMTATVTIETSRVSDVVAIPREFIFRTEDGSFVRRVIAQEEDVIETEDALIIRGIEGADNYIEIREGLDVGDRIISPRS